MIDWVALYTSAWIEIQSPRNSVHQLLVALYTSAWIEISAINAKMDDLWGRTLHECVDWNKISDQQNEIAVKSHSTRVRGLKSE